MADAMLSVMTKTLPVSIIAQRIGELEQWLEAEAPYASFDQYHLDTGTPERAYWHLGYQSALMDVLRCLNGDAGDNGDSANRYPEADPDD